MRDRFSSSLAILSDELCDMGGMCENIILLASDAVINGKPELIGDISNLEEQIDRREREIESLCIKLLLREQPVAHDLRRVSSALKMVTDMERIGDQARDIAEIVGHLAGRSCAEIAGIRLMAENAVKMVNDSADAFARRSIPLARSVIDHDNIVDNLFSDIKSSLIKMIFASPDDGEYALDTLMIAKYFERIGDHATNIAEWVLFSMTGEHAHSE